VGLGANREDTCHQSDTSGTCRRYELSFFVSDFDRTAHAGQRRIDSVGIARFSAPSSAGIGYRGTNPSLNRPSSELIVV
jgi:hypothetical protein